MTQSPIVDDPATPSPAAASTAAPSHWHALLGLDLRSLALFRVGLGVVILGDLATRAVDLRAHYADWGAAPRAAVIQMADTQTQISLHMISGAGIVQAALFLLAGLAATALMIGYRTRLATLVSWALLLSLQARNPMILQGGDVLLRLMLFWAMFLPLHACCSVDRVLDPRPRPIGTTTLSPATVALTMQICFVYWFSVVLKTHTVWWHGHAVEQALHADFYATRAGLWLREWKAVLPWLTWTTLALEAFGPLLLFVPRITGVTRTLAVLLFVGFHLGLNVFLEIGLLSWIAAVAWLALLPGGFWRRIGEGPASLRRAGDALRAGVLTLASRAEVRGGFVARLLERRPINPSPSRVGSVVAALLLVYVLAWNIRSLDEHAEAWPARLDDLGLALRLDQQWHMFAPYPITADGWFVVPGKLVDGREIDLWNGGAVSYDKPRSVADTYHNQRWRKYLENIMLADNTDRYCLHLAKYLCRRWNRYHPPHEQVVELQIVLMREPTFSTGPGPVTPATLWTHHCAP